MDESKYEDPDRCSKKLYNDLLKVWNILSQRDELPKFNFDISPRNYFNLLETNHKVSYSSDFIGPDRKFAHDAGLTNFEIGTYLKVERTIGGHILFPIGEKITINQAKGTNMLDRFDFMLAELRNYFIHVYAPGPDAVYEKNTVFHWQMHLECIKNGL